MQSLEEIVMATDGISRLIAVTQEKAGEANDEAMSGAEKQKSLLGEQKSIRSAQSNFDSLVRDSSPAGADPLAKKTSHKAATATEASVGTPATYLGKFSKSDFGTSSLFSPAVLAKSFDVVVSNVTRYASGIKAFVDALTKKFEESGKKLEGQDRMGNFEIQRLMSAFNEAETLASNVKKKRDDQIGPQMSKIG
jgi:hypothetical protein